MYERTFVVLVDDDVTNDAKQIALMAADELFDVNAEFDHDTDDGGPAKWITVKSKSILNAESAKAYIIACFHPESKCPQIITHDCVDILQDALGLWWRSLESEFKVRIKIVDEIGGGGATTINNNKIESGGVDEKLNIDTDGIKIEIQGDHEPVAYASSYITELDQMIKCPPDESDIDKANIRREFTTELMNFNELKWAKYSTYNPFVLRTLLKWIYFVKGVEPANKECAISFTEVNVPENDKSLIVLSSDDEDNVETEIKINIGDDTEENKSSSATTTNEPTSSSGESFTNTDYNDAKRKIDQNNANSSDDSVELLEPTTSGGVRGIPMQMKKTSTKRFALSLSPSMATTTTTADTKLTVTLNSLEEAIKASSSKTVLKPSESSNMDAELPGFSTFLAGPLSSYRAKSENVLNNLSSSTSASRIQQSNDAVDQYIQPVSQPSTKRVPERLPVCMTSKNINYHSLRPVIIDGSNVAMQAGKNKRFSCRAIMLAAKYFIERGHRVYAFVPQYRQSQNPDNPRKPMDDQWMLTWMENRGLVIFTPSRQIMADDGSRRRYACYDDNMIVQYAHMFGGVMLSKDHYRDVARDQPEWADTIKERLLMFTWVDEQLMIPVDPHGKNGPGINEFLRFKPDERITMDVSKFMDEENCLKTLREIDDALNNAVEHEPWNNSHQRWNRNYTRRPDQYAPSSPTREQPRPLFGFRQGGSQQQQQQRDRPMPQPSWGFRQNAPQQQQEHRPMERNRSNSNICRDDSRSRSPSTHGQRRNSNEQLENLIQQLSEAFPVDVVRRVLDENQGVSDVTMLGNLIMDAMTK